MPKATRNPACRVQAKFVIQLPSMCHSTSAQANVQRHALAIAAAHDCHRVHGRALPVLLYVTLHVPHEAAIVGGSRQAVRNPVHVVLVQGWRVRGNLQDRLYSLRIARWARRSLCNAPKVLSCRIHHAACERLLQRLEAHTVN